MGDLFVVSRRHFDVREGRNTLAHEFASAKIVNILASATLASIVWTAPRGDVCHGDSAVALSVVLGARG